jgi:hypothetical protein
MPKVEYSQSKGLIQKSSSASDTDLFVVSGAAIQPSVTEVQRQLVTVADPGKTGAQLNGLHFVVFDSAQKNIVYFSSTDNAAPATQPSLGAANYIKIEVVDADTNVQAAAKLETQLEAANSELEVNDAAGDGSFKIEGATPYLAAGTATAGDLGIAVSQVNTGLGTSKSVALEPHGVTILDLANEAQFEGRLVFTLAAGSHIGCQKTIIRKDSDNTDNTLTLTGYIANDTGRAARTFTFGGDPDDTAKSLILQWDGTGWVIIKMSAGISITQ